MQRNFKLDFFYRRLIAFGAILLVIIWGATFSVLRQERKAAEAAAEQTMQAVLHGCLTRADDVFQDAYESIYLAQSAEKMGVPFAPLYEAMEAGRQQADTIDHVIQFDRQGKILYSSIPIANLPVDLAGLPDGETLRYLVPNWRNNNNPELFYIVGALVSGDRLAVAVKSRTFAEFVRPSTLGKSFQLSLANRDNQLFSNWNTDIARLTMLKTVKQADECIFWETTPEGQMTIAGISDIQSAPFSLRIALPGEVLLGYYYKHRSQLIVSNVAGSLLLLLGLFFFGRMMKVRLEAGQVLSEEKERFQQLVENLHEVFFVYEVTRQGTLYISPSAEQLWGEPIGDELDFALERVAARVLPADREKFVQARLALLRAEGKLNVECRVRRRDNEIRWVWVRASKLGRAQGNDWIVGVIEDITDRKRLERDLRKMARTDALTELANRAHFFEYGEVERYRATRYAHPLAVMMIDIDFFKQVNDTYGHAVGDHVLVMVTRKCQRLLRSTDLMARIGGEEFGVLLSETDAEDAEKLAKRLQTTVAAQGVPTEGGVVAVTISIGVAELQLEDASFDEVLKRADDALYQAKQNGRNQVAIR